MAENVDLARLVVAMEAQSAKYLRDLDKQRKETRKWRSKVQKNVGSVAKTFRNLAAAAGIGLLTKKIISATIAQERALKQLQQGYETTNGAVGRSVDDMVAHAERLQQMTIFGDEQIIEAQSQLITFTNIANQQFDRTTEAVLDLSTRMGTDLKSSAVQLGKALNDPISNLSALSRSGIQFSDTQKEMIKGLADANRMADAQNIILDELETQFGGSARAARDTFGGALDGVKNAFGDLFEAKGGLQDSRQELEELTELLQDPATLRATNKLTSAVISATAQLATFSAKAITFFGELGVSIVRAFQPSAIAIERLAQIDVELGNIRSRIEWIRNNSEMTDVTRQRLENQELATARDLLAERAKLEQRLSRERDADVQGRSQVDPSLSPVTVGAERLEDSDIGATLQARLDKSFGKLQESLRTDEEAFRESFESRMRLVDEFAERFPEREAEAAEARNRLIKEKNDWLLKQEQEVADARKEVAKSVLDFGIAIAKDGSKAERALLAVKKAIAVREALINLQGAMAKALDTPWPANIGAIASVASIGAGIISTLKGVDTSVPSFLGGGFTGDGPRTGGLDGKGGFAAMLHPGENVIDLQRGGGVTVINNNEIDARGADPSVMGRMEEALERNRELTIAEIIQLQRQGKI